MIIYKHRITKIIKSYIPCISILSLSRADCADFSVSLHRPYHPSLPASLKTTSRVHTELMQVSPYCFWPTLVRPSVGVHRRTKLKYVLASPAVFYMSGYFTLIFLRWEINGCTAVVL